MSDDGKFEDRFDEDSKYGKGLRRVETAAYNTRKNDKADTTREKPLGVLLDGDHIDLARNRGVERAETELSLHSLADNSEQRLRNGDNWRTVDLPAPTGRTPSGRRSSWYEESKCHWFMLIPQE